MNSAWRGRYRMRNLSSGMHLVPLTAFSAPQIEQLGTKDWGNDVSGDSSLTLDPKSRKMRKRELTLFRAFLVQDAVAALAADDDVPGTKHDLRPAICSRDTRRGRGQSGNSRNPREGRRANPGEEGRDLTSAVVRHARGARVLVIHVTPVHDASRRRVSWRRTPPPRAPGPPPCRGTRA